MPDHDLSAFVIMAFDPEFEAIYTDLVKPSLEQAGYEVTRADSIMSQQNILKDIIRNIASSDLIIAELTALNPNVFYELGIAHALRRKTVLLTQSIDDLPFDLRSYRVIAYSTRFDEIGKLRDTLARIAEKAKSDSIDFGNPVIDFLPNAAVSLANEQAVPSQSSSVVSQVDEPEEEKGLWDFAVEGETAMLKSTEVLSRLTEATTLVSQRLTASTADIEEIQKSPVAGSSARMYRIVERTASEILDYANGIESFLPELESSWELFSDGATGMLRASRINGPEDRAAAIQFRDQLSTLGNSITESLDGGRRFRDILARFKGISKSMNRASRKSSLALDKLISQLEQFIAYCAKIITLINDMVAEYDRGHAA
jgi:hypothetical protein